MIECDGMGIALNRYVSRWILFQERHKRAICRSSSHPAYRDDIVEQLSKLFFADLYGFRA